MAIQITSFRMSGVLLYFGFLLPLAFVHSVVFLGAIVWRLVFPSDLTNKVKLWLWGVYCYWLTDKLLYPTFSHFYSAGHSLQFKDYWVWRWSFLRESQYVFLGLLGPEGKALRFFLMWVFIYQLTTSWRRGRLELLLTRWLLQPYKSFL